MKWDVFLPLAIDFLRHSFQYAAMYEGKFSEERLEAPLYDSRNERGRNTVLHQKFDTMLFAQASSILDKAILDYHSLNFLGSQLAAAAFWMVCSNISSKPVCIDQKTMNKFFWLLLDIHWINSMIVFSFLIIIILLLRMFIRCWTVKSCRM
jgi:hypothetical protein